MEIFIVYKEDYPWDVRVEKLAISLCEAKNKVTIISRNLDQRPTVELINNLQIFRIPRTKNLPKMVQKIINLPLWFNPIWI